MLCRNLDFSKSADLEALMDLLESRRRIALDSSESVKIEAQVKAIFERVEKEGLKAIISYNQEFDCKDFSADDFKIAPAKMLTAYQGLKAEERLALELAFNNILDFHRAQKTNSWFISKADGSILGQQIIPMERAGLYVPGGKGGNTPLISSLLMGAVPALVAGVKDIIVVTPPRADKTVSPYILAAAHLAGVKEVYAAGSAWGIAALAFGAGELKKVDVIAGPGNIWVSTAKRLLQGRVAIDLLAGPSEIAIIADESAKADWVAADMLAQAEHDQLSSSIVLTTSASLLAEIRQELHVQLKSLARAEIAKKSLNNWGALVLVKDLEEAIELSNILSPEHLEIITHSPWDLLPKIKNAGAIFLGSYSAEVLGDYLVGTNHVLPTMGTARFSSGLSVDTFCKKSSVIASSASFAKNVAASAALLARLEGLEAHARSAEIRK